MQAINFCNLPLIGVPTASMPIRYGQRYGAQSNSNMFEVGSMSNNEREKYRKAFQEVTGSRNLPTVVVNGELWATEK